MLLIDVLNKKENTKVPFWFMRQAGRYLPEYMALRNKCRQSGMSFLDMCYNSEIATEITMQPIRRFNMSAAIVFSDILVIPNALGWGVEFEDGIGPILNKFSTEDHLASLSHEKSIEKYSIVSGVIKSVRSELDHSKALIGFSGCPLTLACYMIEGGGSKEFGLVQKMLYSDEHLFEHLIETLTKAIYEYLCVQIDAGANVVQLFDSHAGIAHGAIYEKYVTIPNRQIVINLKKKYPHIPIICFPKGSGMLYKSFAENVPCDAISVDNSCSNSFFANTITDQAIQGNLNNYLLAYGSKESVVEEAKNIIRSFQKNGKTFIFNLSHGMLKDTNLENVEALVEYLLDLSYTKSPL